MSKRSSRPTPSRPTSLRLWDAERDFDGPSYEEILAEAQSAERRGQRDVARKGYERALRRLAVEGGGRRASAVLRWIARLHQQDADTDAALDCLEASLAVAEAWRDDAAAGHAINIQAVVRWQCGELDEAERLYLQARARAMRAGDAKLAAMTAQNLGVIANIRGDHGEALKHYENSLAEYRSLGLAKDVMVALNNLGLLHTHQTRFEAAESAFTEAVHISDALGDISARILLDVNLAEMWVARAEYAQAHEAVRHALELAARAGDASAIGQATKLLGVIIRETGDLAEAEEHFRRANELADARQDLLLQAEVAREQADLARRLGRNREVLTYLNRAHRIFTQLRARRDLADVGQRVGRLEDEFERVARRWGESIEAKDRYTQGHCQRVADLSCAIAQRAGFDEQALFWFRIGALLHDVGKIVIPPEILNKPGKLTDDEWALMRSHPSAGVEMLAEVEFPWDVRPIIESHHERWDGKGYPHGIAGEAIPLVARILCVADVYDALTSVRSYKRALTHSEAMELLRRDVGTMFDPTVFAWFEEIAADWAARAVPLPAEGAPPPPEPVVMLAATASGALTAPEHALDDLTQMPLRRAFRDMAEQVLDARRTTGRPVSLLVIDVDHFKLVNDTFGHLQGDDLLRMVADQLRVNTRPSDFVARYAGDEFVALLPGTRLKDAMQIAERVRAVVEASACPRRDKADESVHVTLSIGVASAPAHGETLDALFGAADSALYGAKRRGRNAVTVAAGAGGPREAELLTECFVGRGAERQRLTRALEAATRGRAQLVAIAGEAGVGKTTLLRQLAPAVGIHSGAIVIGRCVEADVRPPYGPWGDVLAAVHATGEVARRSWRELHRLLPALREGGPEMGDAGGGSRFALLEELAEYLTLATDRRPLVVVLDDMQWADAASWDALEYLVPRMAESRLLVCLTIRAEDASADVQERRRRLSHSERFAEIALQRLTRDELAQWARAVLGGQEPEPALLEHLVAYTEGNPLFAVQTVRTLAEDGRLRWVDGRWQYLSGAEAALPTAVGDLLARRLSRLSTATREVLTAAAVIGREFDADLLIAGCQGDEDTVLSAVDEGIAASVVVPLPERGATLLAFAHVLLADVLRRTANPLRLRRIHERIAQALEARTPSAAAELALHYDRAGCSLPAYQNAVVAGEGAMRVYAWEAAADFFEIAARHAAELSHIAESQWRLARVDEAVGRYREAEDRCSLILTTYAAGASAAGIVPAVRRMRAKLHLNLGMPAAQVATECEALLADAREAGDDAGVVNVLTMLSHVHGRLGDMAAAERIAREALAVAERGDAPGLIADAAIRLGGTLIATSPADAVPYYRRALDLFTHLGDRRGELRCHINIGVACDRAGNQPAAEVSYATALNIGRAVQASDLAGVAALNLGVLHMKAGHFAEARARFDEAHALFASVNNEPHRLSALYNLAHLAREEGDTARAAELYAGAGALAAQLGQLDVQVGAAAGGALAELALGAERAAREHLSDAYALIGTRADWWFQGREMLEALVVRLAIRAGDVDQAVTLFRDGVARAEANDQYAAVWLAAECAQPLSEVREEASDLLLRYAVHARALGYAPLIARLGPKKPGGSHRAA